ncbi:phosphogluconate dehydrogenase (NAD(+)-dependent, decarboxylating) [Atopobacter phocae]|uniref:phosphogluconate dehydrogenase (NAD(+)-dependent, decarboxylating) n=1 Tax=Atopobacter phocae TaxID=136492 RepID=UPI00046EC87B|nr:decarboxylating 6-phosphogluconate dehydrogenase [Atopobacter phocae]
MKIGLIGLGKMGLNILLNALDNKWQIYGFDNNADLSKKLSKEGLPVVDSFEELINKLDERKVILLSTPSGEITNSIIAQLVNTLKPGDIIIDSGNSNFNDSVKNYELAKEQDIFFLDCGTSGGMSGARYGACLMVGGDQEAIDVVEKFFIDISCENGYLYTGAPGSGHYLKMVHNGIEYGMMQAIGEGFHVLDKSDYDFDFEKVAKVWNNGSVIRSWLMELTEEAFKDDEKLEKVKGIVSASGEAKWMIEEALRLEIPVPTIAQSLFIRNDSHISDSFSNKVVSSLRNGFGGHSIVKS